MSELDRDELLASGYIRMNCVLDIPHELISLVVLWIKIKIDYWNSTEIKDTITIDKNNEIASGSNGTCVGSIVISKSTITQIWRLKLLKFEDFAFENSFIEIGLIPTTENHVELFEELSECNGYALDLFSGRFFSNANSFGDPLYRNKERLFKQQSTKEGDVITMQYQQIKGPFGQLQFALNDGVPQIGFSNIPIMKGEQYRFGVSFEGHETVQLLDP